MPRDTLPLMPTEIARSSMSPRERELRSRAAQILNGAGLLWTGALTAVGVSGLSLGLGAHILLGQMRIAPARLLRGGA